MTGFQIRPFREADFDPITALWFEAQAAAVPEVMRRMKHDLEDSRRWFRRTALTGRELWVCEVQGAPLGFAALQGEYIDKLYVHPGHHRRGIGSLLMTKARERSPLHLWLHTHMANWNARAFYEKQGFEAQRFHISPPPECEPDVEYHWWKGNVK